MIDKALFAENIQKILYTFGPMFWEEASGIVKVGHNKIYINFKVGTENLPFSVHIDLTTGQEGAVVHCKGDTLLPTVLPYATDNLRQCVELVDYLTGQIKDLLGD